MGSQQAIILEFKPETTARLQRLASAVHRTSDSIVEEAVEEYVARAEEREEFLQSGVAAYEHYRATGLHVTGDEMDAWMLKVEAGEDAPPPECHR